MDAIGDAHGRFPVRHQHHRLVPLLFPQGFQHYRLVQAVEIARRLVEQHERHVMQEGSGDAKSLPLTAGQRVAQLAHGRVIALRQSHYKVVDGRLAAGGLYLRVACVELCDAQVAADA